MQFLADQTVFQGNKTLLLNFLILLTRISEKQKHLKLQLYL